MRKNIKCAECKKPIENPRPNQKVCAGTKDEPSACYRARLRRLMRKHYDKHKKTINHRRSKLYKHNVKSFIEFNDKVYFLGGLCHRKHKFRGRDVTLRRISNKSCVECVKITNEKSRPIKGHRHKGHVITMPDEAKRGCLCCNAMFDSLSKYNRVCDPCKLR